MKGESKTFGFKRLGKVMVLTIGATGRAGSAAARAFMASKAPFRGLVRGLVRRPEDDGVDGDTEVKIPCCLF